MKLFLFLFLTLSTLLSENKFSIIGGYNSSNINYNNNKNYESSLINMNNGFNLGIEEKFDNFLIGLSYHQRGYNSETRTLYAEKILDYDSTIVTSESYGYLAAHYLYYNNLGQSLREFIGIQSGISLGGESEFGNGAIDEIYAGQFNLDAGLTFGMDYIINSKFGVRAMYYFGLTNTRIDIQDDFNYKNRTLSISLLINI